MNQLMLIGPDLIVNLAHVAEVRWAAPDKEGDPRVLVMTLAVPWDHVALTISIRDPEMAKRLWERLCSMATEI